MLQFPIHPSPSLCLPDLAYKRFQIAHERLGLFEGGKMAALLLNIAPDQIPRRGDPFNGYRNEFARKVGVSERNLDVIPRVVVANCLGAV
jgi:hypothetical protein